MQPVYALRTGREITPHAMPCANESNLAGPRSGTDTPPEASNSNNIICSSSSTLCSSSSNNNNEPYAANALRHSLSMTLATSLSSMQPEYGALKVSGAGPCCELCLCLYPLCVSRPAVSGLVNRRSFMFGRWLSSMTRMTFVFAYFWQHSCIQGL